jgi:hypothetical protein
MAAVAAAAPDAAPSPSRFEGPQAAHRAPPPLALIVRDRAGTHSTIEAALSHQRARFLVVRNGAEALARTRDPSAQVVVVFAPLDDQAARAVDLFSQLRRGFPRVRRVAYSSSARVGVGDPSGSLIQAFLQCPFELPSRPRHDAHLRTDGASALDVVGLSPAAGAADDKRFDRGPFVGEQSSARPRRLASRVRTAHKLHLLETAMAGGREADLEVRAALLGLLLSPEDVDDGLARTSPSRDRAAQALARVRKSAGRVRPG